MKTSVVNQNIYFTKALYGSTDYSLAVIKFGNIGTNKGLNRFSLRGKRKVQCQWQYFCMVHNIEKLANYGRLSA